MKTVVGIVVFGVIVLAGGILYAVYRQTSPKPRISPLDAAMVPMDEPKPGGARERSADQVDVSAAVLVELRVEIQAARVHPLQRAKDDHLVRLAREEPIAAQDLGAGVLIRGKLDDPIARRQDPKVTGYMSRLMDRLDIGHALDDEPIGGAA